MRRPPSAGPRLGPEADVELGWRHAALLLFHGVEKGFAAGSQLRLAPVWNRAPAAVERERVALDDVLLDRIERADLNRSIRPDDEGSTEDAIGMPMIPCVVVREEVELVALA